jgi:anti-anti-sigma regulatory factor
MGLKTEQIILDFNLDYLGTGQQTFINNIHKLHQHGVKISLRNITTETIDLARKIKPFISFYKTFDGADFEQNKEYNILMQRLLKKAKINYFN